MNRMNHVNRMNDSRRCGACSTQGGFSLIEVLVALIVCSIGLLGLAKMESLALSSEGVAGTRTIAAMEASSLAAMMHADRGYWGSSSVTSSATLTWNAATSAVTISDATLLGSYNCTTSGATSCTPIQLASYDLQNWAGINAVTSVPGLEALLPGYTVIITCTPPAATVPAVCNVSISWVENAVASNATQNNIAAVSAALPTYQLIVYP